MKTYIILWIGQTISVLGTSMAWFAFTIWTWETTGKATALTLVAFFAFLPDMLLGPFIGSLVDRWNRKWTLIISDAVASLASLIVLALYLSDHLQFWHLYVLSFFVGTFEVLWYTAYTTIITVLVPKEHYVRAEGMSELAITLTDVIAPALAAVLLTVIGFAGMIALDIITLLIAVGITVFLHIPQPKTATTEPTKENLWQASLYGFRYIFQRPSLLILTLGFAIFNFLDTISFTLLNPMILARAVDGQTTLGIVQSAGALGTIVGASVLIVWGGPKRRIHAILIGAVCSYLCGTTLMGLGNVLIVWVIANFFSDFTTPFITGADQGIWLAKVPPNVQGRVLTAQAWIAQLTIPVAMLAAGPLADYILEPAMMPGGKLAPVFGRLVGTGAGSGMSLIFVIAGVIGALFGLSGYLFKAVRNAETILPDHTPENDSGMETEG